MRLLPLFKKIQLLCCILLVVVVSFSFTGKVGAIVFINNLPATDTTIIACGTSAVLTAKTVPGFSNRIWNNGSTGNSLTVNSSGDYWWQVTGTNVVTNGNFSANTNNLGFNSSYTYKSSRSTCDNCCCGVLSLEGTYTINTDPHNIHTNFTSLGDHTSGSGKMLIVNGASIANIVVWTQNITVLPHTDYVFSAWATSVNPQNTAQLQFSINGSPLGSTINPTSDDGVWQYFTATWNSGNLNGPVPIALINQNIAANGNVFAVDDIVFAPVIRQNIHLTLNPLPVLTLSGPHRDHIYYCASKFKKIERCGIRSINIDTIESLVWTIVANSNILIDKAREEVNNLKNPDFIGQLKNSQREFEALKNQEEKYKLNVVNLLNKELLTIDEAEKLMSSNIENLKKYDLKLNEINKKIAFDSIQLQQIDEASELIKQWDKLVFTNDFGFQQQLVQMFVEKIVIDFDDSTEVYTVHIVAKLPYRHEIEAIVSDSKKKIELMNEKKKSSSNKAGFEYNLKHSSLERGRKSLTSYSPPKLNASHQKLYGAATERGEL